jgi:phage-related protein
MNLFLRRFSFPKAKLRGKCRFVALGVNQRCNVFDFLAELKMGDPKTFKKLVALMERAAVYGIERVMDNPQNCKFLKGFPGKSLLEFRAKGKGGWNARVFGFLDGNQLVIITHGLNKKSDHTPAEDTKRLEQCHDDYFDAKRARKLTLETEIEL